MRAPAMPRVGLAWARCGPYRSTGGDDGIRIGTKPTVDHRRRWDGGLLGERGGGTPITLASGQSSPNYIAVDELNVYWTADGVVMSVPLNGGTPTVLASGQFEPEGIAVRGDTVYWTANQNEGAVLSVPRLGGSVLTLASQQRAPAGITTDANSVYWADSLGVAKLSLGGGPVTTLASQGGIRIAVDSASVYWTDAFSVRKVRIDGGSVTTLSEEAGSPFDIAVDAKNVYWLWAFQGEVWKLPK
jgi:hypothetical protein